MIQTVEPGARTGSVRVPSSKSMAHRYLICAALSSGRTVIRCSGMSDDILATAECLKGLGAGITLEDNQMTVLAAERTGRFPEDHPARILDCRESGSTLRFLLPVAGALGCAADFRMAGRLPQRPMDLYETVLREHGMRIHREGAVLHCSGTLEPGTFRIPGNISSQYITGLLLALPLLAEDSRILIQGVLESADYVTMTEHVLAEAGIRFSRVKDGYEICGRQRFSLPGEVQVEGDYSGGAFFLCAGALSGTPGITASGLSDHSPQGDRRVLELLRQFGAEVTEKDGRVTVSGSRLHGITIDASMIPDLIPVLSVVAAAAEGETRICHAGRLRMKESDRIRSTVQMLSDLGADVQETDDGMIITGKPRLTGGCRVDSFGDHRIAMSAAVAACVCEHPVQITGRECVRKSYPSFWEDFSSLSRN